MHFNKIILILLITGMFSIFCAFEVIRKSDFAVLNVVSANKIEVDLNGNNIYDAGEAICIPDIETFTSDLKINQSNLLHSVKISAEDGIKLGYLTDNFADNTLSDRRVRLKFTGIENSECKFADIITDNQSYRKKLVNSGFAFNRGTPLNNENYVKQLKNARKLKLVILNHKSNKYHKLDCKYGLIAHDAIVVPAQQIPEDAKPCKFCHITKTRTFLKKNKKYVEKLLTYPLAISNGSLKLYLSDMTVKLKPDDKCSSLACKEILNRIDDSKTSIDIALYGWDSVAQITNAIKNAKSRGVKVRIVYDTSPAEYYPETKHIVELADESAKDSPNVLMHNKFIIFDNQKVITGSMNFARTGFSGFNSDCIVFVNSAEIAKIYEEEFSQMLAGKFSTSKSSVNHKTIMLGLAKVTPLFSPKDKIITNNVIPIINSAKHYIYIPAFLITHDELSQSLINAKKRGINVKLIVDATNPFMPRSKVKMLRASGIPVKIENYAGKLHSKSIIIDDKYIIAGSMNFSKSGENKNDENALIIEDERLAKYYRGFFEYLWNKVPDKYLKQGVRAEGKYSIGSCTDGIDNNFDGEIDMEDKACN